MTKRSTDIRMRARAYTDRAIDKLVELVERDDVAASTQLAAAKQLLELACAPPPESEPDDEPLEIERPLFKREIRAMERKLHGEEEFQYMRRLMRRPRPKRKDEERRRARERAMRAGAASVHPEGQPSGHRRVGR